MATTATEQHDLFISYAEADRAWVEGYLLDALAEAGADYTDESAFALGSPRVEEFERAVTGSRRIVLVLSRAYFANNWTRFSEVLGQGYGLETASWPVIPLVLEPVAIPPALAALTRLDATNPDMYRRVVERLCTEIRRPVPSAGAPPPCPYPGMSPFSEDDKDLFFGRQDEVADLVRRVRTQRFLTLIGPSGSGKSSLVHAGLIPALRQSRLFGDGEWVVRSVRPGQSPLEELIRALKPATAQPPQVSIKTPAGPLGPRRFLLVIDQFEELFALANQNLGPFYATLESYVRTSDCYLVLTIRADFYPELMGSPIWRAVQMNRYEVSALDEAGLHEAIVGPAALSSVRVYIGADLVERLVADAANEPGALPLIQETLVLLWDHLERRYLPLRAYEALVPPTPAKQRRGSARRTGLQAAMELQAEAALSELQDPARLAIARRMLLQLVQFGEGRPDTRRQQTVAQLADARDDPVDFEHTLGVLINHRLITSSADEDSRARLVDLSHEALIQGWPRYLNWLEDGRADLILARLLRQQADEWLDHGQDEGLVYGGSRLADAKGYAERHAAELRPHEAAFLAAGAAREAARERSRYLGQAAGGAIGVGLGYGIAFALAFAMTYRGVNGQILTVTTFLFMFAMGQVVGFGIGLTLWLWRRGAIGKRLGPILAGGLLGTATYVAFLQFTLAASPDLVHLAVGTLLGGGVGLGVTILRGRWRRLVAATLAGVLAVAAARAIGGITWGPQVVLASGLALGLLAGAGFDLTTAEDRARSSTTSARP